MKHRTQLGGTTYELDTKHQTPGFACLTRTNSDGVVSVPFPQALLRDVVQAVVRGALKNAVAKLIPAWSDDE